MAARFGMILAQRRHELGLSLQQVSNIIKIRPQIIEFFENGDFASMPPRGYAQGMIVSYARFLNLNSQEIVNLYFDELVEYERNSGMQAGTYQDGAAKANRRSDPSQGRFMMVEGGRPLGSTYGGRPPQAGYVTEQGNSGDIRAARDFVRNSSSSMTSSVPAMRGRASDSREGYGDGSHRTNSRRTRVGRDLREQSGYRASSQRGSYGRDAFDAQETQQFSRLGSGQTRAMGRGESARSRNRSSQGRGGNRPDSGYRNNRSLSSDRGRSLNQNGRSRRGGNARSQRGRQSSFSIDPRFIISALLVLVILIVALVFLFSRGCTSASATNDSQGSVVATTSKKSAATDTSDATDDAATQDDAAADGASDGADTATDATDASTDGADATDASAEVVVEPSTFKVAVADGKTAWVEVKVDGKSVYAGQTTGPFEQEFTPTTSIDITTSRPSYVTISQDGTKVQYDTKVSGVAKYSYTVPQQASTDDTADGDATDTADGTDATADTTSDTTATN